MYIFLFCELNNKSIKQNSIQHKVFCLFFYAFMLYAFMLGNFKQF